MYEDISRFRSRVGRKASGNTFGPGARPLPLSVHGNSPAPSPSGRSRPRSARTALRRGFEIMVALMALVGLSVPLVAIFIVLRRRLVAIPTRGRDGKLFGRLNFALDGPGAPFLRETGLDRLPELINVLRGDMSLPQAGGDIPAAPDFPEPAPLLADLRILISILLGRQG